MTKVVLVVGGSTAGLQAALDLANSGLEVYLVERSPFLEGSVQDRESGTRESGEEMPDSPTPRFPDSLFLEAVKHPNIRLFTQAQVTQLQGGRGNFRVEVQQHPRYVDVARCTACGECVAVCPVTVQDTEKAIYKPDHAVPSIFAIQKRGPAPCKAACPAGIHVQGYVALIAQGKFAEALALIREAIPFPGICGRVCHHPCEAACRRAEHDQPIAIEYLKRFVSDNVLRPTSEVLRPTSEVLRPTSPSTTSPSLSNTSSVSSPITSYVLRPKSYVLRPTSSVKRRTSRTRLRWWGAALLASRRPGSWPARVTPPLSSRRCLWRGA